MEKHESDMTPKEKRQAERAKLRGMSPGEKAGYLWTYYKIWLFIPIVLIIVIWQGVQIYHNAQEVELLSVGVADTDLETEEGKSALESDLLEALGTGDEHEVITLDTGISSGEDSASVMKRATVIGAGTMDMLIGNIRGTIGETSVIAIMIGAMFLLLMGVIEITIPASYLLSFIVFIVLFGGHGLDAQYITAHLCGGGLMLGAWFMATDYVTSPITTKGRIIYGICLGLLTGLFRLFGGSAEGVSYAIIIGNLLVPLIEKVTLPKPFGKGGEK